MSVSISTAVCIVMCKQPAIRAPFKTFRGPYFLRKAIKPGISFSAISISFRPHSARVMSARKIKYESRLSKWKNQWKLWDSVRTETCGRIWRGTYCTLKTTAPSVWAAIIKSNLLRNFLLLLQWGVKATEITPGYKKQVNSASQKKQTGGRLRIRNTNIWRINVYAVRKHTTLYAQKNN